VNKEDTEIKKILLFIGVDDDNPNMGTKAKRNLFTKVLEFCISNKEGSYSGWVGLLSMRFNMSVRTVKENYIEPLIDLGILDRNSNKIRYLGVPSTPEEDKANIEELTKKARGK
jgi:hypothetical protein